MKNETMYATGKEAHEFLETVCSDYHDADLYWYEGFVTISEKWQQNGTHRHELIGYQAVADDRTVESYLDLQGVTE